jgi:hypothetical protein
MIHQDGSTHEWVGGQKWDLSIGEDGGKAVHFLVHIQ